MSSGTTKWSLPGTMSTRTQRVAVLEFVLGERVSVEVLVERCPAKMQLDAALLELHGEPHKDDAQ
eukprot:12446161-Heterocapsa_arctica.AAC.1